MVENPAGPGTSAAEGDGGVWSWLLPAVTFLAGAALSAALFVLGDTGDDTDPVTAAPSPSAEATASPTPDELVLQVPSVCVEAGELAGSVSAALGDVVDAAGALDARRLQESIDVVQQLRPDVLAAAEACRELAEDGRVVTPEVTPEPSTAPEPTPTAGTAG